MWQKRNIKSTLKPRNILAPEGQIFSLNKKQTYFENINLGPNINYRKINTIIKTNYLIIDAAEMITETSGNCILIFNQDSAFLNSVMKLILDYASKEVK